MNENFQNLNQQYEDVPSYESFPKLFENLINNFQSSSNLRKNREAQGLKKDLFDILFSQRKGEEDSHTLSELEKLLWYSHLLKRKRKFDDSRNLDNLIKSLRNNNLLEDNGVRNVLLFLTHLIDNEVEISKSQLSIPSPWILSSRHKDTLNLPNYPLCYNDTRLDVAFSRWHYTHFPSHLFNIDENILHSNMKRSLSWHKETFDSCNKEPGLNHRFNFFKKDENEIAKSCFGALTGPRKLKSPITPDTPLSIPNLPNIPEGYSFIHTLSYRSRSNHIHSRTMQKSENTNTVDEGYVSSRCSEAGNYFPKRDDIWEEVLKEGYSSPERFSWETALRRPNLMSKEKPFATEVGSLITRRLWALEQNCVNMIDRSSSVPNCLKISSEDLCTQVLHTLCGIPSSNFFVSKEHNIFVLRAGLYYEGVTAESLRPHLEEFIQTGNKVLKLEEFYLSSFAQNKKCRSEDDKLSKNSFNRAIKNFILFYRQKILSLTGESKLVGLKLKTEPLRKKIDFVYKICLRGVDNKWFSNSLNLIGELSKELLTTRSVDDLYLLLYFFNSACKPFLVFLEKWIYEGDFCDPNVEFMIQVNKEPLHSKTRTYWTKSHVLRSSFIEQLPEFLRGVLVSSFECGKSMNLLKICCPRSYLLESGVARRPKVSLCSSLNEVLLKRLQCQRYGFEMNDLRKKFVVTLDDLDQQSEERRIYLQNIASNRQGDRLQTFQDKKKIQLLQEVEAKRKVLDEIREDIKMSEFWKTKRKEEETKEEEKALLEQKIMEEQKRMEEYKERKFLLEHYEKDMNELKLLEDDLESQLISLKKDLNLNIEKVKSLTDNNKNKNIQDADNDSSSQMSTTPDTVETPNPDLLETPTENAMPSIEKEPTIKSIDNLKIEIQKDDCQNNNNNDEDGIIASDCDLKKSNTASSDTRKTNITDDTLNCNIYNPHTNIDKEALNLKYNYRTSEHGVSSDETDPTASGILDTLSILNNRSYKKRNIIPKSEHEKNISIESKKVSYQNKKDNERNEEENQYKSKTKSNENANKNWRELSHDIENGNMECEDETSKKFGMRKSRSESSSLKESSDKMKRNKESNRFSLYDLNDAPVLIDKVCENEELTEEDSESQVTFLDEELRETISKAVHSSVQSYSQKLSNDKEEISIGSSFLNIKHVEDETIFEDMKESGFLQSNHLSFSPIYIFRGLSEHLQVQSKLVNCALLSHFLVERKLLDHFLAMKSFLLLNDAAFARTLIQNLVYKFPSGRPSPSFLSPMELNGILNETIAASSSFQNPFASNLFFIVTDLSSNSLSNPLEMIDLRYGVNWPLCIILNENVLSLYSNVSKFLMRLHEVMLIVEDSFRHLADLKSRLEGKMSFHFHQINLFRHELQQIIRVLFGYITYQAVEGSWNSFQKNIRKKVSTLDELYESHYQFILEVSEKCFLTPTSTTIKNVIQELFSEAVLFHNVVKSSTWTHDWKNNKFLFIQQRMAGFRDLSSLLNKNLLNLLHLSQQNHVEDLVLHLNFNENFLYQ